MEETQRYIVFKGRKYWHEGRGYWRSTYPQPSIRLHVAIWEAANGKVPEGCEIHHVDLNPSNNALENLQCLTKAEHAKLHMQLREKVACVCIQCGETFYSIKAGSKFCSSKCDQRWRFNRGKRPPKEIRICECCGKEFETRKYGKARYCSPRCTMLGKPSAQKKIPNEGRAQVRSLYATGNYSLKKLAEMYDVSSATIKRIINGK